MHVRVRSGGCGARARDGFGRDKWAGGATEDEGSSQTILSSACPFSSTSPDKVSGGTDLGGEYSRVLRKWAYWSESTLMNSGFGECKQKWLRGLCGWGGERWVGRGGTQAALLLVRRLTTSNILIVVK